MTSSARDLPVQAELSTRILKSLLVEFRRSRGEPALAAAVDRARLGGGIDLPQLEDENNWVSFAAGQRLIDALTEDAGDPHFPRRAGLCTTSPEVLGFLYSFLKAFGTPRMCYVRVLESGAIYNRVGRFEVQRLGRSRVSFTYVSTIPEPNRRFCEYRMGQFESFPTLWGLPPARGRELECQVRGASACRYEFEWLSRSSVLAPALGAAAGGLGAALLGPVTGIPWPPALLAGVGGAFGGVLAALGRNAVQLRARDHLLREQNADMARSVDDLRLRYEQIEELNRTLEEKVAARTRELQVAGERLKVALEQQVEIDRQKTHFFTNISHELRTPLTLILAPLETLLGQGRLEGAARAQLETVHRNALRLLHHINAILDLSRLDAGKERLKLEDTDVHTMLGALLEGARPLAERRGIALVLDAGQIPSEVPVDRDKLEKIFLNLLSNALKFTEPGTDRPARVTVRSRLAGERLLLEVEDTGVGIPADHLDRIFQRFHQVDGSTSRRFEGTGIGLAIVKELAELHMGTVAVDSEVGRGARFTVDLPTRRDAYPDGRIDRRQERVPVVMDRRDAETSGRLRDLISDPAALTLSDLSDVSVRTPTVQDLDKPLLLLVDDNRDMLNYLTALLSKEYRVRTARDGEQAYRMAVQERPALVISDVMMPRRSGPELLRDLRADPRTHHVPIILVTAKADLGSKLEGLEGGADDYLTKPFSFLELKARVAALLMQRRLQRELAEKNEYLHKLNFDLVLSKKEVFLQTIEALAFAVEAKDPYTHGHSRRVSLLSEAVARAMALTEAEIERTRIAAVLHDIGKLGIPESILTKPGRLTADEIRIIKLHPVLGFRVLEGIKELRDINLCILHHHERFDGGGYPGAKNGVEIPLESRIIAVADTYDAMTSDRCYRKGLSHTTAIDELLRTSSTQLDPDCVRAFLQLYEATAPLFPALPSVLGDYSHRLVPGPGPGPQRDSLSV